MSHDDVRTQVAVITTTVGAHHEQLAEVRARLKGIESAQHETNNRLSMMKLCPSPGTCVPLQVAVEAHDKRLRSLEDTRLEARASGRVIAALLVGSGAISSLIGIAISKLWP